MLGNRYVGVLVRWVGLGVQEVSVVMAKTGWVWM